MPAHTPPPALPSGLIIAAVPADLAAYLSRDAQRHKSSLGSAIVRLTEWEKRKQSLLTSAIAEVSP